MRTVVIEHMNVPACGKFEIEWTLRRMMGDPDGDHETLARKVAQHFGEDSKTAETYVRAAWKAYEQLKLRDHLAVAVCEPCEGKGGYLDTTYDRTGAWTNCNHCHGYGHSYSVDALYRLMGVPRVKANGG